MTWCSLTLVMAAAAAKLLQSCPTLLKECLNLKKINKVAYDCFGVAKVK